MDKRVRGLETEYYVVVRGPTGTAPRAGYDALDEAGWPHADLWTPNGGKRYIDGDVAEWASPECLTPRDLLLQDNAGDRDMEQLAIEVETMLLRQGRAVTVHVYENNRQLGGDSQGSHENYQVNRDLHHRLIDVRGTAAQEALATWLALRPLTSGAGHAWCTARASGSDSVNEPGSCRASWAGPSTSEE